MVLENAKERLVVGDKFAEKRVGLFVVRGENVAFYGDMVDIERSRF